MALSIIIITLNDPNLPILLSQISKFDGKFEVIVVNAGNSLNLDGKIKLIENTPKNRGLQLNLGAKEAKFDKFWFLHSDSLIDKNSLNLILNALKNSQIGCFKIKFDKKSLIMKILEICSNLRVKFRNIAFGDQGIFMTKEFYNEMNGFKEIPIMEDYDFSIRVKNKGVKFHQLNSSIITSSKRFNKPLKTIFKMQILQFKFRKKYDIKSIEDAYKKI
ncbi:glycosyltransferase [Campylobacter sp. FMV-PI01]|uniref:Glycosyltransferase n=1 Tax=Campylobacter portucalensis TaxID=2608384 RepID=A0A6L5WJM4_9BACT|nr:glycosyltransferase family 2 protein [Campylobacter portucalensis]MSN96043.1 glycosyltransferase [Campylobacter portucalensis]